MLNLSYNCPYIVYILISILDLLIFEYIDFLYRSILGSSIRCKTQCLTSFIVVDMALGHGFLNFNWITTSSENDIQIFERSSSCFSYKLEMIDNREHVGRSR